MIKNDKRILIISVALFLIVSTIVTAIVIAVNISPKVDKKISYPLLFQAEIDEFAAMYNLDPAFVCAVIREESFFDRNAISRAGAIGLMQMMPTTFDGIKTKRKDSRPDISLTDPRVSIDYGCYYLLYLLDKFDSDIVSTVAAYNAGEGRVGSWLGDMQYCTDGRLDAEKIPFAETREYTKKVIRSYDIYKEKLKK